MRCPRCGNENPETNRFCGMCGATLLPAPAPVASPNRTAQIPAVPAAAIPSPAVPASQNTTATRAAASVPEQQPVISGPSFLGLNEPAPRKRASLSIDPNSAPSASNLDYLLDDEEQPKRGGAGKFILILVALALAVGLGYLRWKNQNFGWLGSSSSKPAAATPSDAPDSSGATPSSGGSTSTAPASAPGASATNPASPSATPADTQTPAATSPAPASPTTTSAAGDATDSAITPNPVAATPSPTTKAETPAAATPPPAPIKHKAVEPDPNVNPPAARPVRAADPVSEAQKYLYGKGAKQDCDRGMRLLKPAADKANPKAMIEMGALYSAGLCTPRDLPTAYRWFAMSLRKDPDNQSVQTDLQKLWGEMTQPERQLAIKLTQ